MGKNILEVAQALQPAGLEYARVMGQPVDPEKPYSRSVMRLAETVTVAPGERFWLYSVYSMNENDFERVYALDTDGHIVQRNVSPLSPTELTFYDYTSDEEYTSLPQLATSQENTLGRVLKNIANAMNKYEDVSLFALLATMASASSHTFNRTSGDEFFDYENLIDMVESVEDYGENIKFIAGANVWKAIRKWDYLEDKNRDVRKAWEELGIEKWKNSVAGSARTIKFKDKTSGATLDSTTLLGATKAYMVALDTEVARPIVMVRRLIKDIDLYGGRVMGDATEQQRMIIPTTPTLVKPGTAKALAIGFVGYEQYTVAGRNNYAVAEYTDTVA